MGRIVRKQIYLDVELNAQLKRGTQERGISEAELIRQALSDEFESSAAKEPRLGRVGSAQRFRALVREHDVLAQSGHANQFEVLFPDDFPN